MVLDPEIFTECLTLSPVLICVIYGFLAVLFGKASAGRWGEMREYSRVGVREDWERVPPVRASLMEIRTVGRVSPTASDASLSCEPPLTGV